MNEIGASFDFAQDRRRAPLQHYGEGAAVAEALPLGVGVVACTSGSLSAFKSGLLTMKMPSCSSVFANAIPSGVGPRVYVVLCRLLTS